MLRNFGRNLETSWEDIQHTSVWYPKINHLHASLRILSNRYSKIDISMYCVMASWMCKVFPPTYRIIWSPWTLKLSSGARCHVCGHVHGSTFAVTNVTEICPCKMTKPSLTPCIQFSIAHNPVVSFRHHSNGQLSDRRFYSLLKKDVLLSIRGPPHRHKARHSGITISNSHPLVTSSWRWRRKRSHKRHYSYS